MKSVLLPLLPLLALLTIQVPPPAPAQTPEQPPTIPTASTAPTPDAMLAEAENLLRSRQFAEAADRLGGVIRDQPENGYAGWLRAVALQAAGKAADCITSCDAVPESSRWHRKARLLKARALTDLKKFAEAETLYAEEAARALSPARKDALAGQLAAFADEVAKEPAPGEADAVPSSPAAAARLYQKALEVDFLTPEFTESTLFKLAVALRKAGQPENALMAFNDYLIQFDQKWVPLEISATSGPDLLQRSTGPRGDLGPKLEKPRDAKRFLKTGTHIAEARLHLTECLCSRPDWTPALKQAEALLALQPAPDAATLADAAWLRCRIIGGQQLYAKDFALSGPLLPLPATSNLSAGQQTSSSSPEDHYPLTDHAAHNEALRAFLAAWPADSHAPEAARLIGSHLLALGKTDEGVAALTDFTEGRGYQFDSAAPVNNKPDVSTELTPLDVLNRTKQEAVFRVAQVEADRKNFAAAITRWRAYTIDFPNGAQWAAAQQGIMDAEFQLGIASVAAGDDRAAREILDAFLTKYPLDDRARQILFIYGQTAHAAAHTRERKDREANPSAPLPAETQELFRAAISEWSRLIAKYPQSGESSLALYNTALILTEKLDRLEEGLAAFRRLSWGQWAALAKERVGILEEKSLAISAPRVFRTSEEPQLALSLRNIKKVKVSRYALDLEAWLRSAHRLGGLEKLDVDLIAPEKTWEVEAAHYAPLRSLQQNIPIPFPDNTAGACVVRVEGDGWQSTTLVVRSDIEVLTEATRGELLVLALNARENKPAAGATVLVSDGSAIIGTGKTSDDGVFRFARDSLPDTVRAFVLTPQGAMVSGLDLGGLTLTKQPDTAAHTTFDRTEYFPGQTAKFLMLRRERKDGAMKPASGKVTLRILAPDNRLVLAQPAEWAADGTVKGSFQIPGKAPAGDYKTQLLDSGDAVLVSAGFPVKEASAENQPQLSLKLSTSILQPGGTLQATLLADWPWGLPLMEEDVEIIFPDGRAERRKTTQGGVLQFEVKATDGTAIPWRQESVRLRLPKRPSAAPVTATFHVTTSPGSVTILPMPGVVPFGETVTAKIRARNFDSSPAGKTLTATLYRLSAPPPSRVLEGVPWISYTAPPVREEKVESFAVTTDPATGEAACTFKAGDGGHYVLRVTDGDKKGIAPAEACVFVSGTADPHSLRLHAPAAMVNEGGTVTLRLQSAKALPQVLITTSAGHFLSHQVISVAAGLTDIPVSVSAAHAPDFRVTAAASQGRDLWAASVSFNVRQGLKLALKTPASPTDDAPLEITDLSGKPVTASVITAMVRTSPDPDAAWAGVAAAPARRDLLQLLNPRDLRLAIHCTADLMFPGSSVKVKEATGTDSGGSALAANDQQRLIEVRDKELGFNNWNSVILTDNKIFTDLNRFVSFDSGSFPGSGSLHFATGVRRAVDTFVQSTRLPAIPDAAEAAGLNDSSDSHASAPAGSVLFSNQRIVGETADPPQTTHAQSAHHISNNAIDSLINNAIDSTSRNAVDSLSNNTVDFLTNLPPQTFGSASRQGSWDSPGDSEAWNGERFSSGVLIDPNQSDGRWLAVVRAWTPETGLVEATLPFVRRTPLQAGIIAHSAVDPAAALDRQKSSLMVLLNRDGLKGEASIQSGGGTVKAMIDGGQLRQVLEVPGGIGWNAIYTLRLQQKQQEYQTSARGNTQLLLPSIPTPHLATVTVGGLLRAEDTVELNLPGTTDQSPAYGLGQIFATPAALLENLAGRSWNGQKPDPVHATASELQARLTLIKRWRAGTSEQKQQAEAGIPGCRNLVSALALSEQNGGWAWGGLDITPDILTTALNWQALWEARQGGITISEKLRGRVEKFLTTSYAGISADDYEKKAAVLHAMAATGIADYANAAPLLRVRAQLSDSALAFLTAALVRMDRMEEARQLLTLLESRARRGKTGGTLETAFWKGSEKIVRLSEPEFITATALWSFARLAPDSATGRAAVNWLLGSRILHPASEPLSLGCATTALDAWFSGPNDWTEPGDAEFLTKAKTGTALEAVTELPPHKPGTAFWQIGLPAAKGTNSFSIRPAAGKPVLFTIVLSGQRETLNDSKPWTHPEITSRWFFHQGLTHGDEPLQATGTSQVKSVEIGQIIRVEAKLKSTAAEARHPQYLVWDEPLPSGFVLVPDSVEGNWDRLDISPGKLLLAYGPGVIEPLEYQLMAVVPGPCPVGAAIIADPYSPDKYHSGPGATLTVLPPGQTSPDTYETNQAEHFELARRTFDSGHSAECLEHLDALASSARKPEFEKDLARMRLWLLTDTPDGDAAQIVQAFETLNERHPSLVIPFDRILRVGQAYQKMGEHERGANVFSAALDANFLTDSGISAVLEDAGDYAGSVDFQEALWFDAPDSEDTRGALFALSQSLFRNASKAETLPVRRGQKKLEKTSLLTRSRDLLTRFITLHPADPLADDAAFSLTNACFALKDYASVTAAAESAVKRHPGSTYLGQFQYMAALGHFWQFHYADALAAAAPVANGGTRDRDLARYITGQIYHAEGKPSEAVDWYRRVKEKYPDAADALAAFEQKKIGLPEIATFAPGDPVQLKVTHRNVREASLQIYKVDLMKLYLREKNLSRVTSVNLAGIAPEASVPLDTADAEPWTDHEAGVTLPLKDEGAYLVIARGDDLFTSGLVLITALKLDIREDAPSGAVRVNVLNAADGKYIADAEVKAIASQSTDIQSGQTDPRGIWEASGLRGLATVIVRQGSNRYAFHRGTIPLTPPGSAGSFPVTPATPQSRSAGNGRFPTEFDPPQIPQTFGGKVLTKDAYLENVDFDNGQIQEGNLKNWDNKRRAAGKGVQADKALKK